MSRACIFCSAPLGANEAVERFPVGRSLAFDGEKGRLWAVCPRCARRDLAPIEERRGGGGGAGALGRAGRSPACGGEKGRLWAVCPRCARWNLAPIEERWEAIEDAERLFRDARLRVHGENVGLARPRGGGRRGRGGG